MDMQKIIEQYERRIYGYLLRYVKIPAEAEDLTQEILIKLWKAHKRIGSVEDQEAYILAMTRNHIRDHFKRMSREADYLKEVMAHMPVQEDSGFATIKRNELNERIDSVIREMPERQRIVYQLIYKQGKSLQDIARELNISPHTVKNHKIQALKFIRSKINPEAFLTLLVIIELLAFS